MLYAIPVQYLKVYILYMFTNDPTTALLAPEHPFRILKKVVYECPCVQLGAAIRTIKQWTLPPFVGYPCFAWFYLIPIATFARMHRLSVTAIKAHRICAATT